MNQIIQQINNLNCKIALTEFSGTLDAADYECINKYKAEIKKLESSIQDYVGIACIITNKQAGYSTYLSTDYLLCCSDTPILFDSRAEAEYYLKEAILGDRSNLTFKFKKLKYSKCKSASHYIKL